MVWSMNWILCCSYGYLIVPVSFVERCLIPLYLWKYQFTTWEQVCCGLSVLFLELSVLYSDCIASWLSFCPIMRSISLLTLFFLECTSYSGSFPFLYKFYDILLISIFFLNSARILIKIVLTVIQFGENWHLNCIVF